MYFDPRPKTKKEDLFDREEELKTFLRVLDYASLIVITGLRRTGKTSFMNVALKESKCPYISLDLRGLPYNPSRAEIVRRLETSFNQIERRWFSSFLEAMRHVKGVNVLGNTISLEWSRTGIDLADLFDRVDVWAKEQGRRFLVAFDEIQLIRGEKNIPRLFAHIMDADQNITLVVTGSEIGLLFGFLGFDDPNSPLYGRHYAEIRMRNFEPDEARAFLETGFQQIMISPSAEVLNYAIQKLNGIVGWLTLFGARCRDHNKCDKNIVDEVVREGGKLARAEALKAAKLSRRYGIVLNFLAKTGAASWTRIKAILEAYENRSLPSSTVTDIINKLVKMSLILKRDEKYVIADPILSYGISQEPLPVV
ncbi:ATP-binding protein [Candidatus Bathyarchaeota archaeon]|nr:ATP-binding protein [Candidatus Bathyarchaeota archaeon]